MTVIRLEDCERACIHQRHRHERLEVKARRVESDVWPDNATELTRSELERLRQTNQFKNVLWELVRAVAFSVGIIVALIALLNLLDVH